MFLPKAHTLLKTSSSCVCFPRIASSNLNPQPAKMSRFVPGQLRLALAILPCFCIAANATTLVDPIPEPSTTRFGATIVTMGDLNGDGVPDFAVAAPFQDGDFESIQRGFGEPQNVGEIFLI